uniref:ARID domain-containing protein n=1 Tax=Onchocerca volvulus TaxID=6282 RepID=A0A8R1TWE8_ONCVO
MHSCVYIYNNHLGIFKIDALKSSDDPPFLSVGTEVSAKFKGAFCEAKVKRMTKSVKCKILLKTPPYGTIFADHTEIKGSLEVNQQVEIVQGKATYRGIIQNIKDNSIYVVVFNDGDERQLRRTQVCIKGAKHFNEDVNLDAMPLYKPESFSSPVVLDDRRGKQKRRNLEQSKRQRQQSTSTSVGDKEGDGERDDDATSSEDDSTLESTTSSTTLSATSNSISEAVTIPVQSGRTLRTRRLASKSVPKRLRSARREITSFFRQSDGDHDLKNGDNEDYDYNNGDGNGSGSSKMHRFTRLPKPSVSRMIADKILTKSIARTRKKRYAATVATDALKRIKESTSNGDKHRLGDNNYYKDENSNDDDGGDSNDNDNDGDDEVDDTDKERRRVRARKKHCSSDDNDDDKSHTTDKKMDMITGSSTSRKSERKRQGLRDKEVEPMTKKRSRDIDGTKKLYKVGNVVAVYDDVMRKGKWTPAVVVAEVPFKTATKGNVNIGKSDILLRSFKDSKYFTCSMNKLSSPGISVLKFAESSPKAAMDRAIAFIEKEIFPAGWERSQIYDDDVRSKKREYRSSSIDQKKRSEASGKAKREIEKKTSAESSSSESESSTDEEYGEERDQFTAQLYKFHEERGTPINRAPILGGKDIDMFRLYNMVQRYGGKKRVTENNQWKLILRKMHLEGCPGATSVTVKNAYSRYLDHFNSFYRNLGISSWLSTPTPSTSSRSERPNRLLDRHNIQLQRRKWASVATKKKEKGQKESVTKGKTTKREKDENIPRTKKEKVKKDERNVTKSDVSEDDDKMKGHGSAPFLCLSPGSKIKSKTKDEEEQDKGSVSDSGTIESIKEKGVFKTEKEPFRVKHRGPKKKDNEKDAIKDEQELGLKTSNIDKRVKVSKINKPEKSSSENYIKRKSPSIISTASNVDQGVSGSDDEAHIRQIRLKEARKFATIGTRLSAEQKELSISKHDGNIVGKDSDISQVLKKEKTKEGVPWINCSPATVLTNFYMGQNVKAYHHGQWYDARVITLGKISHGDVLSSMMDFEARCKAINESMDCDEKEQKEALTRASARLNDRLEGILREMTCCVHYLGWNSRYDEWVELIKIKVHEKDQKLSEEQFLSIASDKLSAPTLEAAVAWRSSVDPARLLTTEVCSSGMRPRRLSHTHEHITHPETRLRSTTFSEKKVKKVLPKVSLTTVDSTVLKTPSDSLKQNAVHPASTNLLTESDAEIVLRRLPEEASVSETSPRPSFVSELISSTVFLSGVIAEKKLSDANSNSKRRRTVSDNRSSAADLSDHPTKTPFIMSVRSTSESGVQKIADNIIIEEAEADYVSVLDEVSRTEQIDAGKMTKFENDGKLSSETTDGNDDKAFSRPTVLEITKIAEEKEQHPDGSERQVKLMILTKSDEVDLKEDFDSKQKRITTMQQISPAEDLIQKIASCKEISLESEIATEDIASKECDDEVWHPPMSLGLKQRGRGIKKKKIGRNASNTLAERKGMGKGGSKQTNNEERSKESEECSSSDNESLPNVRDSWHALKVRMQQKVELEGAMVYAEKELNLEPIDEDLTGEALINSYQERMQELRDIYHSIRADQARLDRRWRKTLEKRKQRDKEHRKKDELFVQSPIGDNVVQ